MLGTSPTGRDLLKFDILTIIEACAVKVVDPTRTLMEKIVLHEDFKSMNNPEIHAQGLVPFIQENSSLQIVRREVLIARGTHRYHDRKGVQDLQAIDQLLNHTSKTLPADFNTGVAWDFQALVQQAQHFDGGNWLIGWTVHEGGMYERLVLDQNYRGRVAEVFEIQTDDGHPAPNPEST
ncbi:hypothetical protein FOMG_15496 [Fusarium oxysporum f. sp. melonis 26406]|uniref:Uncharacterized protein n=1 Tax=Fusarium oxysporum f. sp. melonis 26406 TaxID=1089452 RepID=W9Z9M1_FUSOX|nr:hypothetical protein FOMG_15496 [Fusarium oxysporum f. sp. melonis 26406]